ncbi:hypothetical protein R1A27_06385 [Methylobacterium sp. NMS12]|uniref:hypothetical protein n=1 Tax=Methylobacterium sp. NMS12 TaxID=3079766 RepID=UPI003F88379B
MVTKIPVPPVTIAPAPPLVKPAPRKSGSPPLLPARASRSERPDPRPRRVAQVPVYEEGSMIMEWQSIAGQLAQIGLSALGGPFGGPLGSTIGDLVGKGVPAVLGVEPTPQAVATAIANHPSTAAVNLAQIEAETKGREAEFADMANARAMHLGLADALVGVEHARDSNAAHHRVVDHAHGGALLRPGRIPERVYQLLSQAYGASNLALGTAIAFWLGSSRSSQVKDTQITALLPAATRR